MTEYHYKVPRITLIVKLLKRALCLKCFCKIWKQRVFYEPLDKGFPFELGEQTWGCSCSTNGKKIGDTK